MLVRFKARNHPQQPRRPDVDERGTDPELFRRLDERFHFTLDVAASRTNAKCARYYTRRDDGLSAPWKGRIWCNPPYSNIEPWVARASVERPELVVLLLPANRTEQLWWHRWIEPVRDRPGGPTVEFLAGRPRFSGRLVGDRQTSRWNRPPFGCCLVIWATLLLACATSPARAPLPTLPPPLDLGALLATTPSPPPIDIPPHVRRYPDQRIRAGQCGPGAPAGILVSPAVYAEGINAASELKALRVELGARERLRVTERQAAQDLETACRARAAELEEAVVAAGRVSAWKVVAVFVAGGVLGLATGFAVSKPVVR